MYGFSLISVNWTEEATTPADQEKLISDLPRILDDFNKQYAIDRSELFLASRGESTAMTWEAGFLAADPLWSGVVFLGGVPSGDWENNATQLLEGVHANPPALYYVIGKEDSDYQQALKFSEASSQAEVTLLTDEVDGTTTEAVLDFSDIWIWVRYNGR